MKTKTKRGPIETVATQTEDGVGWAFSTASYRWIWRNRLGLNLFIVDGEEAHQPILYAKSLDHAIMFAHGYETGAARNRNHRCVGPTAEDEDVQRREG